MISREEVASVELGLCEAVWHQPIEFPLHVVKPLDVLDRDSLSCISYLCDSELHAVEIFA